MRSVSDTPQPCISATDVAAAGLYSGVVHRFDTAESFSLGLVPDDAVRLTGLEVSGGHTDVSVHGCYILQ